MRDMPFKFRWKSYLFKNRSEDGTGIILFKVLSM
jgi:hypothetical protein